MIKATCIMITFNEEANLWRALTSVAQFEEVILVDHFSTDKTCEIAQSFANVKLFQKKWTNWGEGKAYAASLSTHDWVFNLDADEELTCPLIDEFKEIIKKNNADALVYKFTEMFINKPNTKWARTHDKIRAFKRSKGGYDAGNLVHEGISTTGISSAAAIPILHYGTQSIDIVVTKNNRYSSLKALEKFQKGKKPSLIKLVLVFPIMFLVGYFIRRQIFNGVRGFILATMWAYYAFLKEAKLWEIYQREIKETSPQASPKDRE